MSDSALISVLLAVSHPLIRRALHVALDNEPDLQIVGEAPTSQTVIPLVRKYHPRVLILDMTLEDSGAFELISAIDQVSTRTRIVAVSNHDSTAHLFEALRRGVAGFVPNGTGLTPLLEAIRTVSTGDIYLCPPWNERTLRTQNGAGRVIHGLTALTPREREVLRLLGRNLDCAAIAEQLGINKRTAETLCRTIRYKLNMPTQDDLLRYVARMQQSRRDSSRRDWRF